MVRASEKHFIHRKCFSEALKVENLWFVFKITKELLFKATTIFARLNMNLIKLIIQIGIGTRAITIAREWVSWTFPVITVRDVRLSSWYHYIHVHCTCIFMPLIHTWCHWVVYSTICSLFSCGADTHTRTRFDDYSQWAIELSTNS